MYGHARALRIANHTERKQTLKQPLDIWVSRKSRFVVVLLPNRGSSAIMRSPGRIANVILGHHRLGQPSSQYTRTYMTAMLARSLFVVL